MNRWNARHRALPDEHRGDRPAGDRGRFVHPAAVEVEFDDVPSQREVVHHGHPVDARSELAQLLEHRLVAWRGGGGRLPVHRGGKGEYQQHGQEWMAQLIHVVTRRSETGQSCEVALLLG